MHKFALVCSIISLVICEIKYSNTDLRLHVSKKLTTESEVIKIISPGQLKPGLSSIDWRESGCVTPVKDQGFICHACWTFSAVAGIEAYYSLKYQRNLSLSEQQLIDCSVHSALGNRGCLGGSQGQAYMYVKDWGIETDDSYPYQEYHRHEGIYQCRANLTNSVAFVSGYYRLRPKDEETMKDFVSSIGPIIIAFDGSLYTFLNYEGGIYEDPDCSRYFMSTFNC